MPALYACLICLPYMSEAHATRVHLRSSAASVCVCVCVCCLLYMSTFDVCLIDVSTLPYMSASYACLRCVWSALYACLICQP